MPQYSKTTWVDGTAPAISAANLNKLEQGVFDSIRQDGSTTMSAQLVTIAGSVTTPAIAPTGDSNTGIFFPAADTIAFGEGGLEAMRINSAGNVGIGTTSISSVIGTTVKVAGTSGATIQLEGSSVGLRHFASDSLNFSVVGTYTNHPLVFETNAQERMRITSAGNVGIGTTTTNHKLEVAGDVSIWGSNASRDILINSDSNYGLLQSYNSKPLKINADGNNILLCASSGYVLIGYTASNGAYPLQVNGQIFATSSTIATSDGKYKKDIVALDGALDIVKALNPVQFSWKEHPVHKFNTDVPTVGFIAQEVEQAFADKSYLTSIIKKSECTWETETGETVEREVTRDVEKQVTREVEREVTETIDGEEVTRTITEELIETVIEQVTEIVQEPVKETHTEEFLGIAESNLIAILTKAVKELNAKVEALEAQLNK